MSPAGGLPSLPPVNPAFSLLSFPHPPAPLPSGKGEIFTLFRRGLRPRHPGVKPLAALTVSAVHVPGGGACPRRHLLSLPRGRGPSQTPPRLRRIVPSPPVPPLLGYRHFPWKGGSFGFAPHRRLFARGARMAETVSAANGLMQGCRGRNPRRNKLIVSPFPTGEGGRGDRGQESKLTARLAGEEKGKPPLRVPEWQGRQATARLRPPAGCRIGRASQCRAGSAPGMQGAKPLA